MKTYALVSRTPTARRDISRVNDAYYPSSATRLADHHSFLVVSFLLTWPRTVLSRARASRAIHPRVVGPIDRRRSEGTPRTHLQSRDRARATSTRARYDGANATPRRVALGPIRRFTRARRYARRAARGRASARARAIRKCERDTSIIQRRTTSGVERARRRGRLRVKIRTAFSSTRGLVARLT